MERHRHAATRPAASAAVREAKHRLRQSYRAVFRAEVTETVGSPANLDDERQMACAAHVRDERHSFFLLTIPSLARCRMRRLYDHSYHHSTAIKQS